MELLRETADVLSPSPERSNRPRHKGIDAGRGVRNAVAKLISWRRRVPRALLVLSLGSYVATLVAFAHAPSAVSQRVFGSVNVAYLLALSQFAITFFIAVAYSISARRVADPLVDEIHAMLDGKVGESHA